VPLNGRIPDERFTGAAGGISRPRISNDFFSTVQMLGLPHSSTNSYCSAPIGQTKQSRASCATLTTASVYSKQLRECQEKKAIPLSRKPTLKEAIWKKE